MKSVRNTGLKVRDISASDISEAIYDIAIWCDGYEERSSYYPSIANKGNIREHAVLGFEDDKMPHERSSSYFAEYWPSNHLSHNTRSLDALIADIERLLPKKSTLNILVDYSCMPRDWYAAILKLRPNGCEHLVIDFSYSIANHVEKIYPPNLVEYYSVYGCESISAPHDCSVAILGLGFEGIAPLKILERLEPDMTEMYISDPGVAQGYAERAINSNVDVIRHYLDDDESRISRFPLRSVQTALRGIYELAFPYLENCSVVLIPVGPKPFVLASILLSMSYKEVSCMNVKKENATRSSAPATGETIFTRVSIKI